MLPASPIDTHGEEFVFRLNAPRPSSPTDNMLSPCSKRLWGKKKSLGKMSHLNNARLQRPKSFQLEDNVSPTSCPANGMRFILGTSSSCRKMVVERLGWKFEQMTADIDEKAIRDDDPRVMPILIAKAKATAIIEKYALNESQEPLILVTADQIVLYKDSVREKPESREQAVEFLSSYSNSFVSTHSAIVVTHLPSGFQQSSLDVATVHWNEIPMEVVEHIINKGEVLHCAGGFVIEDPELNKCANRIEGDLDSVLGLPVELTSRLIKGVLTMVAIAEVTADNANGESLLGGTGSSPRD